MKALSNNVNDVFTRVLLRIRATEIVAISETGRPLFDGKDVQDVVAKLSYASAIGATVKECCAFAGISTDSYYRCLKNNPEFRNHLEQLQTIPTLQARITIMRQLCAGDVKLSMWYLERKCADEFSVSGAIAHQFDELNRKVDYLEGLLRQHNIDYY